MAAGPGAASSGHSGGRASGGFEASLDRRFQGVSNTMDSIQGLCGWCIENKKHHSLIVRYWMKWLKKSDASHRLNLFYVANDVIQNCKRKNAIVFRTSFADVLPDAALLVRDPKVHKSVERIFTIWQERNVYSEEFVTELKTNLVKKEQPPPPAPPVNPKTALKSKVVAEFAPQTFIDQLVSHQRTLEEADLRQKQLAALRVDVCNLNSAEALKRLKDKAGGKKFSSDFEEGSTKLQEFVTFLEGQMQTAPPLLEALSNADIFYEMQYKEVKIVANAYKTFANRVSNLKRKLDALRSTLPDPEDSPIPSPSEDAPSPTGSESPFHGLGGARGGHHHQQLDGRVKELQSDNRDVEDMDLSEEEEPHSSGFIVEDMREKASTSAVSKATTAGPPAMSRPSAATVTNPIKTPVERSANQTPPSSSTAATPTTPTAAPGPSPGPSPLQMNLANVDLGKISSILSSLTSAMKGSGVSPATRPSPTTPTTPSSQSTASKTPVPAPSTPPAANPLASILSRVDITPEGILSVLSKTQAHGPGLQGLSSLLHGVSGPSSGSTSSATTSTPQLSSSSTVTSATGTTATASKAKPAPSNSTKRDLERERMREWEKVREREREKEREKEREAERQREKERERERERQRERERERAEKAAAAAAAAASAAAAAMPSLDSKIHTFLQGNPAFGGLGLDDGDASSSPLLVGDNADGTPVRDEAAATPTQDEMMDSPGPAEKPPPPVTSSHQGLSPTAYRSDLWDAVISPRELLSDAAQTRPKDGDYRPSALRAQQALPLANANASASAKKSAKASGRHKEDEAAATMTMMMMKRKAPAAEQKAKLSRKASGSSEEGRGGEEEEKGKRGGKDSGLAPSSGGGGGGGGGGGKGKGPQYHRIETVVSSSCGEGAPIQALDGGFRRIQTVESIRVIGRGVRRGGGGGGSGGRGAESWYEEQAFMEEEAGEQRERGAANSSGAPSGLHMPPPPPPPHGHMPPGPYQPPYGRPPPPIPQLPPPPRDFLGTTSAVMVGGVLVPIDRVLPNPPSNPTRSEDPPALPRPGTVKEHFAPRHTPPLHRPGTPGVPPPLLGHSPRTPTSPAPQPRNNQRRPTSPASLLRLPSLALPLRPPLPTPPQRPGLRGQAPFLLRTPPFDRKPLFTGGKRPAFAGNQGAAFPPKRPFMPPRY
ncbi:regulation of nuclear pre-mRNA domain-containing protein 2 [Sardina pilchardus]|uniref:regulation of nuclear pre-mRNA domain-containing protein 2 n=1 Tax=Sardina pilchardus TaxID=27697 RepID=UPI002E11B988